MLTTKTDRAAQEWRIQDKVIRLREWGTDNIYRLPPPPVDTFLIGTADTCMFRLVDPSGHTSREHARLERRGGGWFIGVESKNGMRVDGARRTELRLEPGVELGIGRLTLIAESHLLIELRNFLARLLGWGADRMAAVDLALRAIRMSATQRAPFVLCGAGDITQVALSIHRHALGADKPFVVSDPRRREGSGNVRNAENMETGMAAMQRAQGGSLCVSSKRLPRDFDEVRLALRDPTMRVQLIVCADMPRHSKPFNVEPIVVPPLKGRSAEVPRIITEYADEAATELGAHARLNSADRDWVLKHSATSVCEIEKGTRRLVAIRQADDNIAAAARVLGMAPISLARWIGRRALPGTSTAAGSGTRTARR